MDITNIGNHGLAVGIDSRAGLFYEGDQLRSNVRGNEAINDRQVGRHQACGERECCRLTWNAFRASNHQLYAPYILVEMIFQVINA